MEHLFKLLTATLLGLVLTGCAGIKTTELTMKDSVRLEGKTLAVSRYNELPSFAAQTAVNVQFGALGLASAQSSGNKMIKNNGIEDPALSIAREIAQGLAANYRVKVIEADQFVPLNSKVDALVKTFADYDFILDVKTLGWGSIYFTSDWNNYRVMYSAHARLIDVANKTVLAEGLCSHVPDYGNTDDAPTYEQLENGEGLRASLANSVAFCADTIQAATKLQQPTDSALASAK